MVLLILLLIFPLLPSQCLQLADSSISCACYKPFVDSEAGLCTQQGKSKLTAFVLRCTGNCTFECACTFTQKYCLSFTITFT